MAVCSFAGACAVAPRRSPPSLQVMSRGGAMVYPGLSPPASAPGVLRWGRHPQTCPSLRRCGIHPGAELARDCRSCSQKNVVRPSLPKTASSALRGQAFWPSAFEFTQPLTVALQQHLPGCRCSPCHCGPLSLLAPCSANCFSFPCLHRWLSWAHLRKVMRTMQLFRRRKQEWS